MTEVTALPALQQLSDLAPNSSPLSRPWRGRLSPQDSRRQNSKYVRLSRPARVTRSQVNRVIRHRNFNTPQSKWICDDADGRDMAADPSVVLPGDHSRGKPKLERQEAFREPQRWWSHSDVVEDDADLYAMGLLYDDEHSRGSCFNLDTIVHPEPVYSVRPAKRNKKQRQDASYLHVDLTLSLLSSDADVQRFLDPYFDEPAVPVDEITIPQESSNDQAPSSRSYRDAALSTISELPEIPEVSPSLNTDAPVVFEFSDPVFEFKGEQEEALDWALVDNSDLLSSDEITDIDEDGNEVRPDNTHSYSEDAVDTASATGEAWIVLGDGS
ncbi:hypothetical protein F5Y04DRAFT_265086 [Hypomontagnella monticulosa]|nr:hypothetical protein F5Y04DRAFT_265086 [Hypomontagnella monticulosa]